MNIQTVRTGFALAGALFASLALAAQQPAPPLEPASPSKPAAEAKPAPKAPPSLDDLLNLTPDKSPDGTPPAPDVTREDLDKRLANEKPEDLFKQALDLMDSSAKRLADAKDPGLETQRLQEDALRKLDQLISQLKKKKSQQQQQKQQQQQNQDQEDKQSQPQQSGQRQEQRHDAESNTTQLPARRDGALRPGLEAARAAWGALPARIREMLLQGQGEKFSSVYEKMTEEYYKKLAEQRP